jgi:hypothetical protein
VASGESSPESSRKSSSRDSRMKSTNLLATRLSCSETGPAPGGTGYGGQDSGPVGGRGCNDGMGSPRGGPGMSISGDPELPGRMLCGEG